VVGGIDRLKLFGRWVVGKNVHGDLGSSGERDVVIARVCTEIWSRIVLIVYFDQIIQRRQSIQFRPNRRRLADLICNGLPDECDALADVFFYRGFDLCGITTAQRGRGFAVVIG